MSIKDGKITFSLKRGRSKIVIGLLTCVQAALSLILCVSLAAHIIWPEKTLGASGAPLQIAYEGRLTDSSGNALGGTGTAYCFRFSVYDASSGGNKLWPAAATPTATIATSTDGVFNAVIGQADTLSSTVFDFSTTSSAYLQVDVSSSAPTCSSGYESLSPRQQLLASPYAMTANNINYLRSDTANSKAQVGTNAGAGAASPVYLALDVKNTADYVGQTCSTSGLMWYNSATSNALICEGGVIQALGTAATTTIGAITANGSVSAATAGTVNFVNSNGVTFGINGNAITASINAGGGGVTMESYEPYPALSVSGLLSSNGNTSGPASFLEFNVGNYVQADYMNMAASVSFATLNSTNGSQSYTFNYGIYTRGSGASSTILSQITSNSFSLGMSWNSVSFTVNQPTSTNTAGFTYGAASNTTTAQSSAYTGLKQFQLPVGSTLAPGAYWLGLMNRNSSSSSSGGFKISVAGIVIGSSLANNAPFGSFSSAFSTGTNATRNIGGNWYMGNASFSSAGQTNLPSTVALSAMTHNISVRPYMRFYAST